MCTNHFSLRWAAPHILASLLVLVTIAHGGNGDGDGDGATLPRTKSEPNIGNAEPMVTDYDHMRRWWHWKKQEPKMRLISRRPDLLIDKRVKQKFNSDEGLNHQQERLNEALHQAMHQLKKNKQVRTAVHQFNRLTKSGRKRNYMNYVGKLFNNKKFAPPNVMGAVVFREALNGELRSHEGSVNAILAYVQTKLRRDFPADYEALLKLPLPASGECFMAFPLEQRIISKAFLFEEGTKLLPQDIEEKVEAQLTGSDESESEEKPERDEDDVALEQKQKDAQQKYALIKWLKRAGRRIKKLFTKKKKSADEEDEDDDDNIVKMGTYAALQVIKHGRRAFLDENAAVLDWSRIEDTEYKASRGMLAAVKRLIRRLFVKKEKRAYDPAVEAPRRPGELTSEEKAETEVRIRYNPYRDMMADRVPIYDFLQQIHYDVQMRPAHKELMRLNFRQYDHLTTLIRNRYHELDSPWYEFIEERIDRKTFKVFSKADLKSLEPTVAVCNRFKPYVEKALYVHAPDDNVAVELRARVGAQILNSVVNGKQFTSALAKGVTLSLLGSGAIAIVLDVIAWERIMAVACVAGPHGPLCALLFILLNSLTPLFAETFDSMIIKRILIADDGGEFIPKKADGSWNWAVLKSNFQEALVAGTVASIGSIPYNALSLASGWGLFAPMALLNMVGTATSGAMVPLAFANQHTLMSAAVLQQLEAGVYPMPDSDQLVAERRLRALMDEQNLRSKITRFAFRKKFDETKSWHTLTSAPIKRREREEALREWVEREVMRALEVSSTWGMAINSMGIGAGLGFIFGFAPFFILVRTHKISEAIEKVGSIMFNTPTEVLSMGTNTIVSNFVGSEKYQDFWATDAQKSRRIIRLIFEKALLQLNEETEKRARGDMSKTEIYEISDPELWRIYNTKGSLTRKLGRKVVRIMCAGFSLLKRGWAKVRGKKRPKKLHKKIQLEHFFDKYDSSEEESKKQKLRYPDGFTEDDDYDDERSGDEKIEHDSSIFVRVTLYEVNALYQCHDEFLRDGSMRLEDYASGFSTLAWVRRICDFMPKCLAQKLGNDSPMVQLHHTVFSEMEVTEWLNRQLIPALMEKFQSVDEMAEGVYKFEQQRRLRRLATSVEMAFRVLFYSVTAELTKQKGFLEFVRHAGKAKKQHRLNVERYQAVYTHLRTTIADLDCALFRRGNERDLHQDIVPFKQLREFRGKISSYVEMNVIVMREGVLKRAKNRLVYGITEELKGNWWKRKHGDPAVRRVLWAVAHTEALDAADPKFRHLLRSSQGSQTHTGAESPLVQQQGPDALAMYADGRAFRWDNVPLSPRGKVEARTLHSVFKDVPVSHLVASPLERSVDTAHTLLGNAHREGAHLGPEGKGKRFEELHIKLEAGLVERLDHCARPPSFARCEELRAAGYARVDCRYASLFAKQGAPKPKRSLAQLLSEAKAQEEAEARQSRETEGRRTKRAFGPFKRLFGGGKKKSAPAAQMLPSTYVPEQQSQEQLPLPSDTECAQHNELDLVARVRRTLEHLLGALNKQNGYGLGHKRLPTDWLAPGEQQAEHIVLVTHPSVVGAMHDILGGHWQYVTEGSISKFVEFEEEHALRDEHGMTSGASPSPLDAFRPVMVGATRHLGDECREQIKKVQPYWVEGIQEYIASQREKGHEVDDDPDDQEEEEEEQKEERIDEEPDAELDEMENDKLTPPVKEDNDEF